MVRVGLGESGGLVGGHELRGITWRGGLCGRWRVGCEEEYGCGAESCWLFTTSIIYLFCGDLCLMTELRCVTETSPCGQHASSTAA